MNEVRLDTAAPAWALLGGGVRKVEGVRGRGLGCEVDGVGRVEGVTRVEGIRGRGP